MQRILVSFIALLMVIVFIPMLIVTVMSKTIDNNAQGSDKIIEQGIENK